MALVNNVRLPQCGCAEAPAGRLSIAVIGTSATRNCDRPVTGHANVPMGRKRRRWPFVLVAYLRRCSQGTQAVSLSRARPIFRAVGAERDDGSSVPSPYIEPGALIRGAVTKIGETIGAQDVNGP